MSDAFDPEDATEAFTGQGWEPVATDCRDCEHQILALVPVLNPGGDRWVRCGVCHTINRVTADETHVENGGESDAE